jgi:hypothetical protein
VILLGLIVIASVSAKPPRGLKEGEVPFFTGTEVWSDIFETVSSRHEKASNQIVFTLKAKKAGRVGNYYAFIGDGDNVELARLSVKFNPPVTNVSAGTQVQAVVSLGSISAMNVGNLTVRQRR